MQPSLGAKPSIVLNLMPFLFIFGVFLRSLRSLIFVFQKQDEQNPNINFVYESPFGRSQSTRFVTECQYTEWVSPGLLSDSDL